MLALGACSSDVKESQSTVSYPTMNLISPLDGGETFATEGNYSFMLNLTRRTGSVTTSNLKIDNKDYFFETDTVSTENYTTIDGGVLIRLRNLKGYLDNSKDMPLTNGNFDITSLFYVSNISVPGYNTTPDPYPYVIGQYTAGNWSVATFQKDAAYFGSTSTYYNDEAGEQQEYKNDKMLYRVIIDAAKKKADIIIYNAKFAEPAPELKPIILAGLDVTWKRGAYEIHGENVVPQVVEGTSTTPNERYMFNKFDFYTTNVAMTKAQITYDVMGGAFKGTFSGSYVVEIDEKQ